MNKKLVSGVLMLTFAAMTVLAGCGGSNSGGGSADASATAEKSSGNASVVIRLANSSSTGDAVTQGMEKFAELVAEKSNGDIEVQVNSNGVLGNDREAVEALQSGTIEMVDSTTGNTSSFMPALMAFGLPYITSVENNDKLYDALDNGELGEYYKKIADEQGFTLLAFFDYGYRNFVSTKKPITSAADMKGLKVRTTASLVEQEVCNALGATPMQVGWNDTYTAMQQGTVEAEGNTFTILKMAKHDEVIKYAVDSAHEFSMQLVMANKSWFESLTEDQQKILQECALEAAKWERELSLKMADENKQAMIDEGIEVHELTDAERKEFKDATAGVWEKFPNDIPQEAIDMITATQK